LRGPQGPCEQPCKQDNQRLNETHDVSIFSIFGSPIARECTCAVAVPSLIQDGTDRLSASAGHKLLERRQDCITLEGFDNPARCSC
jgi:hypothetical protein